MPRQDYQVWKNPHGIIARDLDSNGYDDLAVTNSTDREDRDVSVLYGQPAGGMSGRADYATGYRPFGLTSGDFNRDNRPDLAISNYYSNKVTVLYAQVGGGFGGAVDHPVLSNPWSVVTNDFNSDGLLDLAVHNGHLGLLYGRAQGGFDPQQYFPFGGGGYGNLVTGDFNLDGRPDLAKTTGNYGNLDVYYTQVGGQFVAPDSYAIGKDAEGLVAGDFNGDGRLDFAAAKWSGQTISILHALPEGGFGDREDYVVGSGPRYLAAEDFNNDGLLDLAVTNTGGGNGNTVSVLYGLAGGGLGDRADFEVDFGPLGICTGDFNNDGFPDIATANHWSHTVSVLYNRIPEPATLSLMVLGGLAVLRRRRKR